MSSTGEAVVASVDGRDEPPFGPFRCKACRRYGDGIPPLKPRQTAFGGRLSRPCGEMRHMPKTLSRSALAPTAAPLLAVQTSSWQLRCARCRLSADSSIEYDLETKARRSLPAPELAGEWSSAHHATTQTRQDHRNQQAR